MYEKAIKYDRVTRDYGMYLDGELVGFARTHHEAEVTLDQLVFELISDDAPPTCEGLQYPCDRPAVHTVPLSPGNAIDGAPITSEMHLCDACYAEWQRWNAGRPEQPDTHSYAAAAAHLDVAIAIGAATTRLCQDATARGWTADDEAKRRALASLDHAAMHAAMLACPEPPADPLPDPGPEGPGVPGDERPCTDVCPSCGDQLLWEGPSLCSACAEDQRINADDHTIHHPRYTRAAGFDKRFERGDPYAGDAWRDATGLLRWVAVGHDPNINNPVRV